MLIVFFPALRVNEYIIIEKNYEVIKKWPADSIHQIHECCRSIGETEGHDYELEVSVTGSKGGLWDILISDS